MRPALRAGLLGAALAACDEPRLTLRFDVPPPFSPGVELVVLRVLVPPPATDFGCADLAFGEVDDDLLRISEVANVRARDGGEVPLVDIDREAAKIFIAEGQDADGAPVVVGCGEVGVIEDGTDVALVAEPVTRIRVADAPALTIPVGAKPEGPVVLEVLDRFDRTVQGVRARWSIVRTQSPPVEGEATTDAQGRASVVLPTVDRPGPYGLVVRVRWAEAALPPILGFGRPVPTALQLPGRARGYRVGAIGPTAEPGVAMLLEAGAEVRAALVYRGPSGLTTRRTAPLPGFDVALGILPAPGPGARERPLVVAEDLWAEVDAEGRLAARPEFEPPTEAGRRPTRVVAAEPCTDAPPRVLVSYADGLVTPVFDAEAGLVGAISERLDVLDSGCIATAAGNDVRALILDQGALLGLAVAAQLDPVTAPLELTSASWFAVAGTGSFAPVVGAEDPVLLGTQLSVNDFVVARLQLRRSPPNGLVVEARATDPAPVLPIISVGGDVDADGQLDVATLYPRREAGLTVGYSVWIQLGGRPGGISLRADAPVVDDEFTNPTLRLVDFDEDGYDDLVVAERFLSAPVGASTTRVAVFAMGP